MLVQASHSAIHDLHTGLPKRQRETGMQSARQSLAHAALNTRVVCSLPRAASRTDGPGAEWTRGQKICQFKGVLLHPPFLIMQPSPPRVLVYIHPYPPRKGIWWARNTQALESTPRVRVKRYRETHIILIAVFAAPPPPHFSV